MTEHDSAQPPIPPLLGTVIDVEWKDSSERWWRRGKVVAWDNKLRKHEVLYDDELDLPPVLECFWGARASRYRLPGKLCSILCSLTLKGTMNHSHEVLHHHHPYRQGPKREDASQKYRLVPSEPRFLTTHLPAAVQLRLAIPLWCPRNLLGHQSSLLSPTTTSTTLLSLMRRSNPLVCFALQCLLICLRGLPDSDSRVVGFFFVVGTY
jgi:hypothetical protein